MSRFVNNHLFYRKQELCHANSGNDTFFVARGVINREGREVKQYTSFLNYQAYAEFIKGVPPKERNFYEQIKADTPCWEYYDIDDWADKSITPKQLYNSFLDYRIKWGSSEDIDVESSRADFTVLDSSKYNSDGELVKGSLHILSQNVSFPNTETHKEFVQNFVQSLPSDFPKLDHSVYSRNRVFRLENNTKTGEYRPLKKPSWLPDVKMYRTTPVPYLITVDVDSSKMWNISPEVLEERRRLKEARKQALASLPKVEGLEGIFFDIVEYIREGKHPRCDSEITNCLNYANFYKFTMAVLSALGLDFLEKQWDTVFHLYRHADDSNLKSQFTSIANIATDEIDTTSLLWWAKPLKKFQIEHPEHCAVLSNFELPQDVEYTECKNLEVNGFSSVSYIDLLNEYDTVFVKGNMGCGKTEKIRSLVPLYKNIVFVSSKKSLAYHFSKNYPEFVLYDDSDMKGTIDIEQHHKVIIQVDSLKRLIGQVDLLIVDEMIDLTSQLLSSINKTDSIIAFEDYVASSHKRLIMDANLNRIDFFSLLVKLENSIFVKDSKIYHTSKTIIEHDDPNQFTLDILEISDGRMFVPSDSKTFISSTSELYIKKYPERKVLVLTSDSNYKDRQQDWDDYDVIFCSPTITAGVSHKTKIDHVYGYYTKRSINAWSATQQLLRCRNWSQAHIYFGKVGKPDNETPMSDDLLEKYIDRRFSTKIGEFQGLKINRIKKTIEKNFTYYMYLENLKRKKRSQNFFRYYFLKIMGEHGIKLDDTIPTIYAHTDESVKEFKTERKLIETEAHDTLISNMLHLAINSPEPTSEEVANFKARKFDRIHKPRLEVMYMNEVYGSCPKTHDGIETYIGKKKHYKNICRVVQNLDSQTELDGTNYSHLDIKEQNDIQRRTLGQMILKGAGFTGLLDKRTIAISSEMGEFVRKNADKIQTIFNSHKKVTLESNKNLMCFVNSKLEEVFGIKLVGKNKRTKGIDSKVYTIEGMDIWSEVQGEEKPCITDKLQPLLRGK
jgi:hypothetical protein